MGRRQTPTRTMRQLVVHLESGQFMEMRPSPFPPHNRDADMIVSRWSDSAKDVSRRRRAF
jgi:hypothetical protein